MIMFYAKPFDEKMRKQLVKIWKKNPKKKHVSNFSSLLIDGMETKKKYKSVLLVSKYLTIAKIQQNLHNRPKGITKNWLKIDNFIKRRL